MAEILRIGFLSHNNPFDRTAFSGTTFHAARALARRPDLETRILGPHQRRGALGARIATRFGDRGRHGIGTPDAATLDGLDAVVGLVASRLLDPLLETSPVPLLHVTDATTSFLREFYGREISAERAEREARVVRGVARTVYSSRFMADRALVEYGITADRVAHVPFGVNLDTLPALPQPKPPLDPLRLLFIGTDWRRKGGDIALDAVGRLRAGGRDVRLTLVGATPDQALPDGVTAAGFLDKNRPRDAARLTRLLTEAHLLVLPTRADCTPMVIAEANAYGAPVLVTLTGGIGSLMEEGVNGRTLPENASPAAWAAAIAELAADPEAFRAMSRSAFDHASARLTWDAWAHDIAAIARRSTGAAT